MTSAPLGDELDGRRQELLALRAQLGAARRAAPTPAVARALEMADTYVFLGLTYLGHTDTLFPEQT
jgi:hypothetical protein